MRSNSLNEVIFFKRGDLIIDTERKKQGIITKVMKSTVIVGWFLVSAKKYEREDMRLKTTARQKIMNGTWLYSSVDKKDKE